MDLSSRRTWTTDDERCFIAELSGSNPVLCARYCQTILTVPRVWDKTVDPAEVRRFATLTVNRLTSPIKMRHAGVLESERS